MVMMVSVIGELRQRRKVSRVAGLARLGPVDRVHGLCNDSECKLAMKGCGEGLKHGRKSWDLAWQRQVGSGHLGFA